VAKFHFTHSRLTKQHSVTKHFKEKSKISKSKENQKPPAPLPTPMNQVWIQPVNLGGRFQ